MKHNWEYLRLGNIAPSAPFKDAITSADGKYWCLNLDKIESNTGVVLEYDFVEETELGGSVHKFTTDNVLFSKLRPNLNKVVVPEKNGYCTTELVPLHPLSILNRYYLAYYLRSPKYVNYLVGKTGGAKMPRVKMDIFWNSIIPVPPIEVQEQIVVELDKINQVIEDCRELQRHLDALAQSLFYDFFGDPITNPKGWNLKLFAKVFKLSSGDGLSAKNIVLGKYPVYGGNGIVGYHNVPNLKGENIIIGRVGALCGNVRYVVGDIFVTDNAFKTSIIDTPLNLLFAQRLLTLLNLRKYANAVAQPVISNMALKNIPIIIPPLSLQKKFAARIEQIEAQKKTVEETIANLQTLLDSRMDYWFN